ncbi:MAG: hypothetical protein EOO80_16730, partial [Oxalobacteraceae bacterium]
MSRNPAETAVPTPRNFRFRARRTISFMLLGSALAATVAISATNGLLGEQWKRISLRAWQQAAVSTQNASDRALEYQEAWLPTRLTGFFRSTRPSRNTEPALAARTRASTATSARLTGSAPVTGTAVARVTGGPQWVNTRPLAPADYKLPTTLPYVDKTSPAYTRFKGWVDSAVNGSPGYAFAAIEAAMMYQLSPEAKYCTLAVRMVEEQVSSAEATIASGGRPEVSGDSYLEVGPMIADLSMTLRTCSATISTSQRTRWSAYAEQAIWNVWNHDNARWGGRSFPWSGWSTDNPGNNYYYSFVEATMYWALASGNMTWINDLRDRRLPALQAYFANLPGGGSSEGTGYGTAHMRLFAIYHLWQSATGIDLANANPHTTDSVYYWINATVPTLDRFAPIGDQSRNSVPELYDYHRRLVLEARYDTNDNAAKNAAT